MTRIGAIFPGQGSQSAGMLGALTTDWPIVEETFAEASEILGHDLWQLARDNPDGRLDQTEFTQPAMLAADTAVLRVWRAAGGPEPDCVAGHSLGEYAALVAAGVIEFGPAVGLVAKRASLMQNAVPRGEGGMAAILGLDDETVARVCESVPGNRIVEPVNYNAPGQVVIAGHADAVEDAIKRAQEAGARRAVPLAVSVPAHSSLMKEAADELAAEFDRLTFTAPRMPVVHNVDAATHADAGEIREALRRQLYNPVRWAETIGELRDRGAHTLVELGPGKVLTGLIRRIDRGLTGMAVEDPETLTRTLAHCRGEAV